MAEQFLSYWPKEANPSIGTYAVNYTQKWKEFGEKYHWRLSWAFSPYFAMFIGPNSEIIPINSSIRDEMESLERKVIELNERLKLEKIESTETK